MPFCKECGTFYPNSLEICPKCNARALQSEMDAQQNGESPMTDAELRAARKKSWIQICIGVPALIGAIYGIMYLMKLISGR